MTLTKQQLNSFIANSLIVSLAIAMLIAALTVQMGYQICNTLDNLVLNSLRPTMSLPQAFIPAGLIAGSSPADDILIEWKTKRDSIQTAIDNHSHNLSGSEAAKVEGIAPIINFPEAIAPQDLDLTDFSLKELKELAKLRGDIIGYSKMSKAKLLAALQ